MSLLFLFALLLLCCWLLQFPVLLATHPHVSYILCRIVSWDATYGGFLLFTFSYDIFFYCTGALSEENLLFLEAWRTIDRAYVDKTFNGQSWFRYRENALRNEPMNNREETCIWNIFSSHFVFSS